MSGAGQWPSLEELGALIDGELDEAQRAAIAHHLEASPEDRERAVQRFVRLDPSRSRPGTGLGLAMVEAIAALHHGWLELSDNAPGLCARLSLPRA